jgi:hypothetical protein
MRQRSRSAKAKRDIKTRQHLMERSFARATRYGFDRARWRGLWRMEIQECLVCAIQNIDVLIAKGFAPRAAPAVALKQVRTMLSNNGTRIRNFMDALGVCSQYRRVLLGLCHFFCTKYLFCEMCRRDP